MHADRIQSVIERHGRAVVGLLLLVGILSVRIWVVTPHLTSLKAAQQYKRATGDRLEKSKVINRQLRAKHTRLEKLTEEYALLSDMAFSPEKAEEFLSGLEVLCEQSGCVVVSLSFMNGSDETADGRGISVVAKRVALAVHGRYGNLVKLIAKLQARREKVWIDEFQMSRLASDSSRVVCRITITIYVNLDEESVGYEQGPIHQS